jgi:S-(hydroxymethyl)glutathione dehydrogenase / alcohol dehydrogenase
MKALVLNALGHGFDFEEVEISPPSVAKFLSTCKRRAFVIPNPLFATHDIVPLPAVLGHEVAGIVAEVGPDGA